MLVAGKITKISARIIAGLLCLTCSFGVYHAKAEAAEDLKRAVQCSFVIPSDFRATAEKGVFENVNAPMESSTIRFSYYDNGRDRVLTNREKQELEASGEAEIIDESLNLTEDLYQRALSAAYTKQYGKDVGFKVTSFDKIKVDGYPGYKIRADYQAPDEERIYQTTYIIVSSNRMFTISFQRAEDDDCEELFEESAATIHVR